MLEPRKRYTIINELVKQGKSIIMVSSELPEVIGMSDRVIVIYDGRINKVLEKKNYRNKYNEICRQ